MTTIEKQYSKSTNLPPAFTPSRTCPTVIPSIPTIFAIMLPLTPRLEIVCHNANAQWFAPGLDNYHVRNSVVYVCGASFAEQSTSCTDHYLDTANGWVQFQQRGQ